MISHDLLWHDSIAEAFITCVQKFHCKIHQKSVQQHSHIILSTDANSTQNKKNKEHNHQVSVEQEVEEDHHVADIYLYIAPCRQT